MTAGAATFKSIVGVLVVLVIVFVVKEVIFNFFPLLENMSPDADWWNPFIDKSIAQMIYPNDSIGSLIIGFWGFTLGLVIGLIRNIIDIAQEIE